jgi:WhiB family transcriptional regulator, redox-sensing transcriptional regulator
MNRPDMSPCQAGVLGDAAESSATRRGGRARIGFTSLRQGYLAISPLRTRRPARTVLEMTDTRRLPKPVAHEWDWQLRGSCQGLNSSVFFHPDGERGSARSRRADRAKAICRRCPVLEECRRHALAVREPYGVWGGLTEEERRALWTSDRQLLVS